MRTRIWIDDELMNRTLQATGLKNKRAVVELGLRTLLRLRQQEEIKRFRGRFDWQGDLNGLRTDKPRISEAASTRGYGTQDP